MVRSDNQKRYDKKKQRLNRSTKSFFRNSEKFVNPDVILLFFSCGTVEDEDTGSENEPQNTELNSAVVQTPASLIHLTDNLDEQNKLG